MFGGRINTQLHAHTYLLAKKAASDTWPGSSSGAGEFSSATRVSITRVAGAA